MECSLWSTTSCNPVIQRVLITPCTSLWHHSPDGKKDLAIFGFIIRCVLGYPTELRFYVLYKIDLRKCRFLYRSRRILPQQHHQEPTLTKSSSEWPAQQRSKRPAARIDMNWFMSQMPPYRTDSYPKQLHTTQHTQSTDSHNIMLQQPTPSTAP